MVLLTQFSSSWDFPLASSKARRLESQSSLWFRAGPSDTDRWRIYKQRANQERRHFEIGRKNAY